MKKCHRCRKEYDTEKVLCPACMADPRRLQGRHRPSRFELDAEWIVTKSGAKIPLFDRTIRVDLNGTLITQAILDIVTAAANERAGPVNIMLCRVGTAYGGVPRLIADRGEIYDALARLLKESDENVVTSASEP